VGNLTAFVLAGGRSSRMGRDKAFLMLQGRTLLERAKDLARSVTPDIGIVGQQEKFGAEAVEDVIPGCGPLGGIHAALAQSKTELNLILAVDLPFIETKFLAYLVSRAEENNALVTVPHAGGSWQPLCAVYRRAFSDAAERSLRSGSYKIDRLFKDVETNAISEGEIIKAGFSSAMFRNLNTPQEFEEAEKSCES
jgi:molybdenum cofactor guanylyltransferase